MAEQKPNDPSSKSKAEGERWRPLDEEISNQESVPPRGRSQMDTPRRCDQPIEDDDDPVMPSDDATVNTKI